MRDQGLLGLQQEGDWESSGEWWAGGRSVWSETRPSVVCEFQTRQRGPLGSEGHSEEWERQQRDLIESTRSSGELRPLPMYIIYVSLQGMWEMSEMWNPVTSSSHEVQGYMGVDRRY